MTEPTPRRSPGPLAVARRARGWSQARAARELAGLAAARGVATAAPASLKTQLSRWENGHTRPDPPYPALLGELFGCPADELGLGSDAQPAAASAARLRGRLDRGAAVDTVAVAHWGRQLAALRGLDDTLGAAGTGASVRALVIDLSAASAQVPAGPARRPLRTLLAAASILAAEQALDQGDPDQAWDLLDPALGAARDAAAVPTEPAVPTDPAEPADPADPVDRVIEVMIAQAAVLIAVDRPVTALALLDEAPPGRGPTVRLHLGIARAEALVAVGDTHAAGAALDVVHPVARAGPVVELAEYRHARGQVLAAAGHPDAPAVLTRALLPPPPGARARAARHAALALAHARHGDAAEGARHGTLALDLARAIGSVRTQNLLAGLPG